MIIATWNIQCGKGTDGRVDLDRIVEVLTEEGLPDVVCLQEVARHMPALDGGRGADQVADLARRLPDFETAFGAAIDRLGQEEGRAQLGNLVLSRLPILQVFRHALPQPAEPGVLHMPRHAIEAVVAAPFGPLRIVTTHFEFHSAAQRLAQAERLRDLHREVCENVDLPAADADMGSPYETVPRPSALVCCGDFNALPDDPVYRCLLRDFPAPVPRLRDAWRVVCEGQPHAPTCGVHDREQWPEGPHCRDYFLVTPDVGAQIEALRVNTTTSASDHQPLWLHLRNDPGERPGR